MDEAQYRATKFGVDLERRFVMTQSNAKGDAVEAACALREATNLAVSLHRQHYAHVTQWRPHDDIRGVISQIDNMTTGLMARPEPEGDAVEAVARAMMNEARAVAGEIGEALPSDEEVNATDMEFMQRLARAAIEAMRAAHVTAQQENGND